MSDNNNHKTPYNAADIQRYLRGQMSGSEMHDLEKAAMDDPFLADAIEGYSVSSIDAYAGIPADLQSLQERLEERVDGQDRAKLIPFSWKSWWKIAAMVLIIAGAGTFLYYVGKYGKANNNLVAKETASELKLKTADTARSLSNLPFDTGNIALNRPNESVSPSISAQNNSTLLRSAPPATSSTPPAAPGAVAPALESNNRARIFSDSGNSITTLSKEGAQKAEAKATESIVSGYGAARSTQKFSGKVVTTGNQPVPDLSVSVQTGYQELDTKTDANGFFSFTTPDSTASVVLTKKGFDTARLQLKGNTPLQKIVITDQQQTADLDEVVLNKKSLPTTEEVVAVAQQPMNAEPLIGFPAYNQYLKNNKKSYGSLTAHGDVVLSFIVSEDGKLSDYKIERSVSKQTDNEAVRLVKEGPPWKVLSKKRELVTLTIKF